MSAPNLDDDDEVLSIPQTISYVAGCLQISLAEAHQMVAEAIASGELLVVTMPHSGGNH